MQHIAHCLNPALNKICEQVLTLETLTAIVWSYFTDEHIKQHCTVGSFNKGCLVLTVTHAVWASELRYQLPALRDYLRNHAPLRQLITLKLHINLEQNSHQPPTLAQSKLSLSAQQSILNGSQHLSHPPLQHALQRLARHHANSSTTVKGL